MNYFFDIIKIVCFNYRGFLTIFFDALFDDHYLTPYKTPAFVGVFKIFQKMIENKSTWGIIVVSWFFSLFLEDLRITKSPFEINNLLKMMNFRFLSKIDICSFSFLLRMHVPIMPITVASKWWVIRYAHKKRPPKMALGASLIAWKKP